MQQASVGFDNELYLEQQTQAILDRVAMFDGKLYLEFGGKLIFDYHAARVLPGFDPNVKIRLLQQLKDQADIVLCIYAGDIEHKKLRADFGITYDADALKLIDDLRHWGLDVRAVVITRYDGQASADHFRTRLERRDVRVYTHTPTKGYPFDIDRIVGDDGYGTQSYVDTEKPLVVVTGPGPGSGKLATCLCQLYHDYRRGTRSGYAKFETFPIWNLPLKHPVNVAYESATADLKDVNLIDPHHMDAYGKVAVNYNRDVEAFPLLRMVFEKITGSQPLYKSPTDMGVNRAGFAITDDAVVRQAAEQEVIRRYLRYKCEYALGFSDEETIRRAELLMKEMDVVPEDRAVVEPARQAACDARRRGKGNDGIFCGAAIRLHDGTIITGSNSSLMHASSALVLNAIKHLANLLHEIDLLSSNTIGSIGRLKTDILNRRSVSLNLEDTLIALSISATLNPTAHLAMQRIKELHGCEIHMTHMPPPGDEAGLRTLGVNLTADPNFSSRELFIR